MEEINLRQIKGKIDSLVGEQLKQIKQELIKSLFKKVKRQIFKRWIKQKLLESLPIKVDWQFQEQVRKVSEKIFYETGMVNEHNDFLAANGDLLKLNGKFYWFDKMGFLVNTEYWDKDVAEYFAKQEGINLTDAHWEIINFLREYYEEWRIALVTHMFIKIIKKKFGAEKGNLKYLYELFPKGAMQANKIAGIPGPMGD